jgi:hypothetical protein
MDYNDMADVSLMGLEETLANNFTNSNTPNGGYVVANDGTDMAVNNAIDNYRGMMKLRSGGGFTRNRDSYTAPIPISSGIRDTAGMALGRDGLHNNPGVLAGIVNTASGMPLTGQQQGQIANAFESLVEPEQTRLREDVILNRIDSLETGRPKYTFTPVQKGLSNSNFV